MYSSRHDLEGILGRENTTAELACSGDELIVLSCQGSSVARLCVLKMDQLEITLASSWDVPGEVSCLAITNHSKGPLIVVGSTENNGPVLTIFTVQGEKIAQKTIRQDNGESTASSQSSKYHQLTVPLEFPLENEGTVDAFTSVCFVEQSETSLSFVAGSRCGYLLVARVQLSQESCITHGLERIGLAPVRVFQASWAGNTPKSVFATCDGVLSHLSKICSTRLRFKQKDTMWPVDASDPSMSAPPISSVFSMQPGSATLTQKPFLLLLSGSRLYLADVEGHVGSVPRILSLGATPTRVIYSNIWGCLVVALQTTEGMSLALLDPDTGLSISKSLTGDRTEGPLDGFGRKGDRILCLHEWLYVKDGQTFPFILATTLTGRLLIVSVNVNKLPPDPDRPLERLQHFTRYRKKGLEGPVYSVVADDEGMVYCAGTKLHRDVLDLSKRKMKSVNEYQLPSPATSLEIVDGKLLVLTNSHSLEFIDYKEDMKLVHADAVARSAIHMSTIRPTNDRSMWPVTLISDAGGNVRGVWAPYGHPQQDLVTIFEAKLYNSVRRFALANCRPTSRREEQRLARFGCLPSRGDGAEVLGVSLDGTLRNFRLLGMELWRYVNLVQRLTRKMVMVESSEGGHSTMYEDSLEPITDPKAMHIDGDILTYCLQRQLLEEMVRDDDCLPLFCRCLDELEGGLHTDGFRGLHGWDGEATPKYFTLGYEVLEYLLSPIL